MKTKQFFLKNPSNWLFYSLVILAILGCFLLLKNYLPTKPRQTGESSLEKKDSNAAKIFISPSKIKTERNSDFIVDVMVDPSSYKVSNLDLFLKFDSSKLSLNDIEQSEEFNQVLLKNIDQNQGNAKFSAGTDFGKNVSKITRYARLHFHAIESGESFLQIDKQKSGVYSDDNPGINDLNLVENGNVSIEDENK